MTDPVEEFDPDALRREGLMASSGGGAVEHDGTGRVDLSFTVEDKEAPPAQRKVRVPPGVTVFDSASWNGIAIDSTCGGHGTCHKCKVQLTPATPATRHDERTFSKDQLEDGWRLACLARATRDHAVVVPPLTTRPKAATVGVGRQVILRPAVQKRYVELAEPTLEDQVDRPGPACSPRSTTSSRGPTSTCSAGCPRCCARRASRSPPSIVDEELIEIEPGDTTALRYAIAYDLGTTTVVATLLDLVTGTPVAVASMLNKQQPFGGDVISRISATMMDPDAAERLRVAACETLASLAHQVCREGGVDPAHVYEVAIAGNATMTALALGIDPEPLGVAPFIMTVAQPPTVLAADLGLPLHPRARAMLFPALGAYVGGDIVAGMLASGMDRDTRTRLFIDVGTNCEIVLSNGDQIVSTAAPAGPAFEGGAIRCGMRADDGAIEVVKLDPGDRRRRGDARGHRRRRTPRACAAPASSTSWPSWCKVGLLDASGRFVTDEVAKEVAPGLADRLTTLDSDRGAGAGLRAAPPDPRRRPGRVRGAEPARRARAAVRQGRDLDRLDAAARGARARAPRRPAGAAGRLVRELPLRRVRHPHRPGAEAARCCASSPRATWPARARRWRCSRSASGPGPWRCWRR